jgi:hypothetical protein
MKEKRKRTIGPLLDRKRQRRNYFVTPVRISISLCCIALVLGVWAGNRRASTIISTMPAVTREAQSSSIQSIPPPGTSIQRMDIEVITIRPTGFERTQITRPKGRFGIAVENRCGLAELVLRLDQEGGPRLRQGQLSSKNLNWKEVFDLLPGHYVLTEAGNPSWLCRITITEN